MLISNFSGQTLHRVDKLEQFLIDETFSGSRDRNDRFRSRNKNGKLKIDKKRKIEKKRKRRNLQGGEMDGEGDKRRLDLIALSAVASWGSRRKCGLSRDGNAIDSATYGKHPRSSPCCPY